MGASSASPAASMMVGFFEPVRPALSVTTRLTTKLPALAYGCFIRIPGGDYDGRILRTGSAGAVGHDQVDDEAPRTRVWVRRNPAVRPAALHRDRRAIRTMDDRRAVAKVPGDVRDRLALGGRRRARVEHHHFVPTRRGR